MIVHLLGSNGAGKSTLVRRLMMGYRGKLDYYVDGRQKPMYSLLNGSKTMDDLTVVGHYEITNGGGDTIKYWSDILDTVKKAVQHGGHVLLEGPTGREYELRDYAANQVRVVWLQPSLTTCVQGVQARGASINAERITRSLNRCRRIAAEYREREVMVNEYQDRAEALHAVQSILRSN